MVYTFIKGRIHSSTVSSFWYLSLFAAESQCQVCFCLSLAVCVCVRRFFFLKNHWTNFNEMVFKLQSSWHLQLPVVRNSIQNSCHSELTVICPKVATPRWTLYHDLHCFLHRSFHPEQTNWQRETQPWKGEWDLFTGTSRDIKKQDLRNEPVEKQMWRKSSHK